MCIPPIDEEPAMHFALLKKLANQAGLSTLSMGMSGDYGGHSFWCFSCGLAHQFLVRVPPINLSIDHMPGTAFFRR